MFANRRNGASGDDVRERLAGILMLREGAARLLLGILAGLPSVGTCDQIYRNALWRYEVSFPESWTQDSSSPEGVAYRSWSDAPHDMNMLTCNTHAALSESTVTMSQDQVNAKHLATRDEARAFVEKQIGSVSETFVWDIGHAKAIGFVNEGSVSADKQAFPFTSISITLYRPGIVYNVTCGAPRSRFSAVRPTLERVLRSTRLP